MRTSFVTALLGGVFLCPIGAWSECSVPPTTITHSQGTPSAKRTILLDTKAYPTALCNDGTPGAYAIRRGFGAAANRWVIWLHGSGACVDQATCAPRYKTPQSSSVFYELGFPIGTGDGIQSQLPAHNPDFYDANLVVIAYCSSDLWTGETDGDPSYPPTDVRSWHFRGRDIVKAVVDDLVTNQGLGPSAEVMVGGGSSGATGVFETINDLQFLGVHRRLVATADAGYDIDAQGFDSHDPDGVNPDTPTPMERLIASGSQLWKGRGDAVCTSQATTFQERQQCYSPPTITHGNYVQTPMFVRQSEDDREMLHYNGLLVQNGTSKQTNGPSYMLYWANLMAQSLGTLDPQHTPFGTYDTNHVMMENADFYTTEETFTGSSGSYTTLIDQALGHWYQDPCASTPAIQQPPPFTP